MKHKYQKVVTKLMNIMLAQTVWNDVKSLTMNGMPVSANKEIFPNQLCSPGPSLTLCWSKFLQKKRWSDRGGGTSPIKHSPLFGFTVCLSHLSSFFDVFAELENLVRF